MEMLAKKPLFNPDGDTDVRLRRMIGGNTTNLNDFNNMRYSWVSGWYRQAMNNFWIPEEISLAQDVKDYPRLDAAERTAYDKILSFLVFLDSIQTANLPNLGEYITANEVNLCLNIQTFQECVHSQSYSYMLDTICSPTQRDNILYQWKTDEHLLRRNTFIGECYNAFQSEKSPEALLRALMANYILEGVYFYSGFMFFYNLSRNGKMPGSAQEIRYINRDENTHLWLFRNIISGLLLALLMSNAGGLWDNAKKYIESGHFGGKGSDAHKAAVIGDTVGDPFKDTAGPSINTQITVVSLVSSLAAVLFLTYSIF